MDYKQIISIADFMAYSPDQGSIHTGNTIQTSINNAISILNGFTNGLLSEVVNFNYELNQDGEAQFISDRDATNTLYRSDSQLASLEDACLQETQYVLNMGNDLTKGSFSGSFGGVSGSRSVPLEASVVPQHVILNLQAANVYTLQEFKSVDYANNDTSTYDPNAQITWDALNDSFMRAANYSTPNTVLAGNGGGVTNTPINSLSVAQATNANQILDIDSQYKPLNDTLALANVQQSVDSKLEAVNVLQQQLEVSLNQINAFLPTINQIQTQVTNNLNSINQLVTDLRNGNVIFGNAQINTTQTYPKNYLGYVLDGSNKTWYLSQQAVPANTQITNTTYWVNVSQAGTINVDLSNYYTKTESDNKYQTQSGMSGYATTNALNSNVSTLNNSISQKVATSTFNSLTSTLRNQSFVTNSYVPSMDVQYTSKIPINSSNFITVSSGINQHYMFATNQTITNDNIRVESIRFFVYTNSNRTTLNTDIQACDIMGYSIVNGKLVITANRDIVRDNIWSYQVLYTRIFNTSLSKTNIRTS